MIITLPQRRLGPRNKDETSETEIYDPPKAGMSDHASKQAPSGYNDAAILSHLAESKLKGQIEHRRVGAVSEVLRCAHDGVRAA